MLMLHFLVLSSTVIRFLHVPSTLTVGDKEETELVPPWAVYLPFCLAQHQHPERSPLWCVAVNHRGFLGWRPSEHFLLGAPWGSVSYQNRQPCSGSFLSLHLIIQTVQFSAIVSLWWIISLIWQRLHLWLATSESTDAHHHCMNILGCRCGCPGLPVHLLPQHVRLTHLTLLPQAASWCLLFSRISLFPCFGFFPLKDSQKWSY